MEIRVPSLGVGMSEGILVQWLVEDGSPVTEGQPIYELETEKLATEIESPGGGTIRHIGVAGETYDVGELIAEIS
jgi:pyruvate/2-oxoglutarate dehydrogenase complex dihydrolipoamide acyltransferase (E2) component